jgi:hypothetical protein
LKTDKLKHKAYVFWLKNHFAFPLFLLSNFGYSLLFLCFELVSCLYEVSNMWLALLVFNSDLSEGKMENLKSQKDFVY